MTPFEVRREKAREVFLLTRRLNERNRRKAKNTTKDGKQIIRRKAGDDWF